MATMAVCWKLGSGTGYSKWFWLWKCFGIQLLINKMTINLTKRAMSKVKSFNVQKFKYYYNEYEFYWIWNLCHIIYNFSWKSWKSIYMLLRFIKIIDEFSLFFIQFMNFYWIPLILMSLNDISNYFQFL
jgi:hypothetical protein